MMAERPGTLVPFALRDLEWVISAPFLLKSPPEPALAALPETGELLARLTADPAPLLAYLEATGPLNLGRYFERLMIFWLENLPAVTLLGSNIRISDDKRTLGEIDLLFLYGAVAYHWELAVKFYLNIGDGGNEASYMGPMLKDRLDRKLDRLFGHQITLPERAATKSTLLRLGIETVLSQPFVKGCLFHPLARLRTAPQLPDRIAPDSLSGHWLTLPEIESAALPRFDHFLLLEKKRWITPWFYRGEAISGCPERLATAMQAAFEQRSAPQLVALFRDEGREILANAGRYFITPGTWPALARKAHDSQKLGD